MATNETKAIMADVGEVLSTLKETAEFLNDTQRSRYLHPMIKNEMWLKEQEINRVLAKHG